MIWKTKVVGESGSVENYETLNKPRIKDGFIILGMGDNRDRLIKLNNVVLIDMEREGDE